MSDFSGIEDRLMRIEKRLAALEGSQAEAAPVDPRHQNIAEVFSEPQASGASTAQPWNPPSFDSIKKSTENQSGESLTNVMGIAGVAAFVLAAIYMIVLGVDQGWLTPQRQVGIAGIFGILLIVAGMALPGRVRYVSLLPAAGVVVIYLAIYGGHVYHELISWPIAFACVCGATMIGLMLGKMLGNSLYAYVSLVGCFLAPFALRSSMMSLNSPALFYSAWTLLFCAYSVLTKNRTIYIVTGYLALIGFDFVWRGMVSDVWYKAIFFQFEIFAIIAVTAALFTYRHKKPMSYQEGLSHLPLLTLFYAVQFFEMAKYTDLTPWISLASAVVLAMLYFLVRGKLGESLAGGSIVVGYYSALVLAHAGFFVLVPEGWRLWSSLLFLGAIGFGLSKVVFDIKSHWPFATIFVVIFAFVSLALFDRDNLQSAPALNLLHVLYGVIPYLVYFVAAKKGLHQRAIAFAYIGHVNMMGAMIYLLPSLLMVSLLWTALAMLIMGIAYKTQDKPLSKSALIIFGASALKLLFYDLAKSGSLARIGILVIVGVSLFAGGWVYQKINAQPAKS